jgi:hypothetical protein
MAAKDASKRGQVRENSVVPPGLEFLLPLSQPWFPPHGALFSLGFIFSPLVTPDCRKEVLTGMLEAVPQTRHILFAPRELLKQTSPIPAHCRCRASRAKAPRHTWSGF